MATGVPEARRRKLAAILAADVVGSSRLMAEDEAAALAALDGLRRGVLEPSLAAHGGRLFKAMGDGFLAEFPSAVEALRCALEVQEALRAEGGGFALRIGVHQGDVVATEDGSDLLGDGVNVAARLEALAEPGGVVVSGRVREDAEGRLNIETEDLGEKELKNIPRPVRVFRVRATTKSNGAAFAGPTTSGLPLPDRPSLVVLPFQNLSGDPEQEYFADGMVEEITAALSRIRWLFVIARSSAFTYKGRAVDVRRVGRELGVRYVLEGSVRRAGSRVRIAGQLVEAETGGHVWADRFDGTMEAIFELQDRVAEAVAGAVEPSLRAAEVCRAEAKPTGSFVAYDLYLRALPHFYAMTTEGTDRALALLRDALLLDPGFALAQGMAANCIAHRAAQGRAAASEAEEAVRLARAAVLAEPGDPEALALAATGIGYCGLDTGAAHAAVGRALALNPNSAHALTIAGWVACWLCRPEEALAHLERAMRLSPLSPELARMLSGIALAHLVAGRYEAALAAARKALAQRSDWSESHRFLVVALSVLGRREEAAGAARRFREVAPAGARVRADFTRRLFSDPAFAEARIRALREAGLPE